jgi:tripartite-type tricarboxylate transporter receptor subunit TctC
MPAETIGRLNDEVNESLSSADLKASMAKIGFEPVGGSPRDFATLIARDLQKWAPIASAAGFQME